jgi:hypothetical protein
VTNVLLGKVASMTMLAVTRGSPYFVNPSKGSRESPCSTHSADLLNLKCMLFVCFSLSCKADLLVSRVAKSIGQHFTAETAESSVSPQRAPSEQWLISKHDSQDIPYRDPAV